MAQELPGIYAEIDVGGEYIRVPDTAYAVSIRQGRKVETGYNIWRRSTSLTAGYRFERAKWFGAPVFGKTPKVEVSLSEAHGHAENSERFTWNLSPILNIDGTNRANTLWLAATWEFEQDVTSYQADVSVRGAKAPGAGTFNPFVGITYRRVQQYTELYGDWDVSFRKLVTDSKLNSDMYGVFLGGSLQVVSSESWGLNLDPVARVMLAEVDLKVDQDPNQNVGNFNTMSITDDRLQVVPEASVTMRLWGNPRPSTSIELAVGVSGTWDAPNLHLPERVGDLAHIDGGDYYTAFARVGFSFHF